MLLGDFFVNMWYNKNDYEDQRMTIRIHDDVENNYVEHIKAGKNDYFSYNMTEGLSCKMRIIGSNSSKKERWSSSNKKILTVKNGKITAKKTGVATLKCKVNGITIKKKVTVHKNVYTQPSAKIKDMLLDRIYYHVVKTYFSGNKLKVKIKLYNTYTDRKLKVIKALDVKIYANGGCLHQRVINKKVNMKAYSSKTITVTVSKNSKMKHTIDLRNNAFTSDINLQTAYYSYKYTY